MRLRWKQVIEVYERWDDRYNEMNTYRVAGPASLQYLDPNNLIDEVWIDVPMVKFELRTKWIDGNVVKQETEIV